MCVFVCVYQSLSCVRLFVTPWAVARQAPHHVVHRLHSWVYAQRSWKQGAQFGALWGPRGVECGVGGKLKKEGIYIYTHTHI